jgi:hypothetical protein
VFHVGGGAAGPIGGLTGLILKFVLRGWVRGQKIKKKEKKKVIFNLFTN